MFLIYPLLTGFQINPIAGLDPQESFMSLTAVGNGMSYNDLIGQVIDSAIKG